MEIIRNIWRLTTFSRGGETERDWRETGEAPEAGVDVSLQFRAGRVGDCSEGTAGPRRQNIPG